MWTARGLNASKTAFNKGIHITVSLTSRLFCLLKQVITDEVGNRHAIKVYINFKFVNLKHNINVVLIRVFPVYMSKKIKTGRNHIIIQMNGLNIDWFFRHPWPEFSLFLNCFWKTILKIVNKTKTSASLSVKDKLKIGEVFKNVSV